MRVAATLLIAFAAAGFTTQDAEKALDGEWAGTVSATALSIDAKGASASLIEGGVSTSGPFKVVSVAGGAATIAINGKRFIAHVREGGKLLMLAPEGQALARSLDRVR